uniref:GNAT family N-acetyltransferase n=1 Tax=Roseihalotalea indica TaxID=2867963 RepID=A0AA49JJR1_9BACT|nr:GNAT family N-acetyltransferase [Tunicatimonas sp. TK19036]
MNIEYSIKSAKELSKKEIIQFENLLAKQGQVNKSQGKAEMCNKICLVYVNKVHIGIGALKEVYKRPFEYAGVDELKEDFKYELGYLFVDNSSNENDFRGLGIGKNITRLLLNEAKTENVFATTELSTNNSMYYILNSFGFMSIGNPYKGKSTGKLLTLMILNKQ